MSVWNENSFKNLQLFKCVASCSQLKHSVCEVLGLIRQKTRTFFVPSITLWRSRIFSSLNAFIFIDWFWIMFSISSVWLWELFWTVEFEVAAILEFKISVSNSLILLWAWCSSLWSVISRVVFGDATSDESLSNERVFFTVENEIVVDVDRKKCWEL